MRCLLKATVRRVGIRYQSDESITEQPDAEYWRMRASQLEEKLLAAQQFMGQCARQSNGFDQAAKGWEYWPIDRYGSEIDYNTFFETNSKGQRPCVFNGLDVVPQEWGDTKFWSDTLKGTQIPLYASDANLPRGLQEQNTETNSEDFLKTGASRVFYGPEATHLDLRMAEIPLPETHPQVLENFMIPKYFTQDLLQFCMQSEQLRASQLHNRSELEANSPRSALPLLYLGEEPHIISGFPLLTVAPRGMKTSLHKTAYNQHSWIHIAGGSLEVILFSPMYTPAIYETGSDTFMLDAFEPDYELFPSAIMAYPWKVTLTAGETLFIPADTAFQWRSTSDSLFTTMQFTDWSNVELALYDYQRMASCGHPAFIEMMKGFNSSFISLPQCSKADEPIDTPYGAYLTWKNDVKGKEGGTA